MPHSLNPELDLIPAVEAMGKKLFPRCIMIIVGSFSDKTGLPVKNW